MTVGVVVIGRNEGERLRRCLESVVNSVRSVVYVDSGSSDGSVELARTQGVEVVRLDLAMPFTAARARNAGFQHLVALAPDLAHVQFVDGDCELSPDWIASAIAALASRPDVAIVAGRLHERYPDVSIYNRLGDLEWNFSGPGEVAAVGGIFMIRRDAFESVGGFDPTVAAGEEPELCQRLTASGWRLWRLDCLMAWHDLGMTRFGQWWRRQVRTGHGGLDVAQRFGLARFRRNNWRARFWTAWLLAFVAIGLGLMPWEGTVFGPVAALSLAVLWPLQLVRIAIRTWRQGRPPQVALAYAFFTMLSFWPQMLGQIGYFTDRQRGRPPRLIEYKANHAGIRSRVQTDAVATKAGLR